jgi:hypothetical protein
MRAGLLFLDAFFWVFHTALILFNVLGWIPLRTRRWNLITLGLTAFSWLVMGLWKGVGYCVCTDLHFRVREALGIHDSASSYLQLMVFRFTGYWPQTALVNKVAGIVFAVSVVASIALNVRDWRRRRAAKSP